MKKKPDFIQNFMFSPRMILNLNRYVLRLNIMDLRMFIQVEKEMNPLLVEEAQENLGDEGKNKYDCDKEFSIIKFPEEGIGFGSKRKRGYIRSLVIQKEGLRDHLLWQVEVLARDKEEKRIGGLIIGNLDDSGFLSMSMEETRRLANAGINKFKHALRLVQSLDPIGVGARNVREAFLIQLVLRGSTEDEYLYRIICKYLEDLRKGNYEKITQALSITFDDVKRAKKRIACFNPEPAVGFGGEDVVHIKPDVFMDKNNGFYYVEVNEQDLPKISINQYYKSILRDKNTPVETVNYIKKKFLSARRLINAIRQRKRVISRVCNYLAGIQKDFLDKGGEAIRPLTLRQVADALSISEATVNRVVSNKYVHVWNAVLSLKSFFPTVAKYREGLGILPLDLCQKSS